LGRGRYNTKNLGGPAAKTKMRRGVRAEGGRLGGGQNMPQKWHSSAKKIEKGATAREGKL